MTLSPWAAVLTALPLYVSAVGLSSGTLAPVAAGLADVDHPASCLDGFDDIIILREDFGSSQYINDRPPAEIGFDAFGSVWRPVSTDDEPAPSSIIVTAGTAGCWAGGRVLGDPSGEAFEDHLPDEAAAISVLGRRLSPMDFEVSWIQVSDAPHALQSSRNIANLTIKNSLLQNIRGDCINLNGMIGTMVIEDLLIDGCSHLVNDVFGNFIQLKDAQLSVSNSLIRLQAGRDEPITPTVLLPSGERPRIKIVDTVFLLEGPISLLESLIVGAQVDIEECRDNIIILGDGGQVIGPLPPCFQIIRDQSLWTTSKNEWLENHEVLVLDSDDSEDPDDDTSDDDPDPDDDTSDDDPDPDDDTSDDDPDPDDDADTPGAPWSDGTLWDDGTGWL